MHRRALLVGINHYPNPAHELRGCLNDVAQVGDLLTRHFAFTDDREIRVLTDRQATSNGIRRGLEWLVADTQAGDVLVFHYSGHGSQVRDDNGDEADGLDETLCPYDFDWDHTFTDDQLAACVAGLPRGVHLTVILDCCHSGTGLRELPPGMRALARFIPPPPPPHPGPATNRAVPRTNNPLGLRSTRGAAILIAACRDNQVSADAYLDDGFHGAATYFLCRAAEACGYRAPYDRVIDSARELLRQNRFDQVPQLEGPASLRRSNIFSGSAVMVAR